MKYATVLAALATVAYCQNANPYVAPTAKDRRGPCPMVNTLANHGFLPHNGLNISLADLLVAFEKGVNLAPAATTLVGKKGLLASTTGNNNTFNIDDLNKHGVIEHDGSLSRGDDAQGDNHSFNAKIWAATTATFKNKTISLPAAIDARKTRLAAAKAANPKFKMSADDVQFSAIETALYMTVMEDPQAKTQARKEWVDILFMKERLPIAEGWKKSATQLTAPGLLKLAGEIGKA
ncbi:hypothetical protein VTL71DRAFT_12506 [Oculimacula yallundae]|uniref:Heme haloperoxidase family profile domain-containing protein n=1 Tax=Oculimacula yallundae TaxID=86028 RepID=A0ABR4CPI1_9HELO